MWFYVRLCSGADFELCEVAVEHHRLSLPQCSYPSFLRSYPACLLPMPMHAVPACAPELKPCHAVHAVPCRWDPLRSLTHIYAHAAANGPSWVILHASCLMLLPMPLPVLMQTTPTWMGGGNGNRTGSSPSSPSVPTPAGTAQGFIAAFTATNLSSSTMALTIPTVQMAVAADQMASLQQPSMAGLQQQAGGEGKGHDLAAIFRVPTALQHTAQAPQQAQHAQQALQHGSRGRVAPVQRQPAGPLLPARRLFSHIIDSSAALVHGTPSHAKQQ